MPRLVVCGEMSSADARAVLGRIELAGLVDGAGQPATRPNRQLPRQDFHLQERATSAAHHNAAVPCGSCRALRSGVSDRPARCLGARDVRARPPGSGPAGRLRIRVHYRRRLCGRLSGALIDTVRASRSNGTVPGQLAPACRIQVRPANVAPQYSGHHNAGARKARGRRFTASPSPGTFA